MEEICLQCGDKGFDNAFVYCIRCQKVPIHRYCLDVIPATFDECVPWVCDFCEDEARKNICYICEYGAQMRNHMVSERSKMVSVDTDDDEESPDEFPLWQCDEMKDDNASFCESDEQLRFHPSSSRELQEQKAEGRLIREDQTQDVTLKKENTGKKRKNIDSNTGIPDPFVVACNGSLRSSKEKKTNVPSEVTPVKQTRSISPAQPLEEETQGFSLENHRGDKIIERRSPSPKSELIDDGQSAEPLEETKRVSLKNHSIDEITEERGSSPNSKHIDDGQCPDNEEGGTPVVILPAEPLIIPTWRGSFSICNKENDMLDGLAAHLSNKACQKAIDAASQFQPVLRLEMLPKIHVWPKSFESSGPRGDNIALYFFPSNISAQVFESLIQKMISTDLALKASLHDAELLIFTSLELPLLYWKFQGKHFLWGVFRKKQDNSNVSAINPEDNIVPDKEDWW